MADVEYTIRRKILTLLGAKFHIYNGVGELIGFSKQKAFKLREDIRVYRDESMDQEMLRIKARNIIDFSAAYDVMDPRTDERIGVLKRAGFSSIMRDSWIVMDANEQQVGKIEEDSMLMALVRRFLSNLVPQVFSFTGTDGTELATFRTHFNPFVHRMTVRVHDNCPLDQAVPLAAGILLVAVEGRQSG